MLGFSGAGLVLEVGLLVVGFGGSGVRVPKKRRVLRKMATALEEVVVFLVGVLAVFFGVRGVLGC